MVLADYELWRIKALVNLMDNKFNFLGIRFGIDPLLGLIPGLGDVLPVLLSAYLIGLGVKYKIPREQLMKMVVYSAVDWIIGLIPLVGDVADVFIRSHQKNYEVLSRHLNKASRG